MTFVLRLTPVDPSLGVTVVIVGGVVSCTGAAVVNVHVTLAASALPAASFTRGSVAPPTTVARYVVPAASGAFGVSVAVSDDAL